jgi:hypothetical protein
LFGIVTGVLAKEAVREVLAVRVNEQVMDPAQGPVLDDHPGEKTYPELAVTVRVTRLPRENAAEQLPGQEMPRGLLVTAPEP